MVTEQEIKEWLATHDTTGMSQKDIAKEMAIEAFQNAKFAEDYYPGLKEKIIKAIQDS